MNKELKKVLDEIALHCHKRASWTQGIKGMEHLKKQLCKLVEMHGYIRCENCGSYACECCDKCHNSLWACNCCKEIK